MFELRAIDEENIRQDLNSSMEEIEEKLETNVKLGMDMYDAKFQLELLRSKMAKISFQQQKRVKKSEWLRLVNNLVGIHNMPLWIGSTVSLLIYLIDYFWNFNDPTIKKEKLFVSIGLMVFVFLFGLFSYYMDIKCDFYIDSCRHLIQRKVVVIRDGLYHQINETQLVIGDLLSFTEGDQIQVDLKIVECYGVTIDYQSLTNQERFLYDQIYGTSDRLFRRGDLLFQFSKIFRGNGVAIVMKTSPDSYLSLIKTNQIPHIRKAKKDQGYQIDQKKQTALESHPTLTKELDSFLTHLSYLAIGVSFKFFVIGFLMGYSWLHLSMTFIAMYIGIITEAVLPTFNVGKACVTKRLAQKNCYIQNIESLETLGMVSAICTNKTGFITDQKMLVSHLWCHDQMFKSHDFLMRFQNQPDLLLDPIFSLVRCSTLCTFAHFLNNVNNRESPFLREAVGKPTEVAIHRFMKAFTDDSENFFKENFSHDYRKCMSVCFNNFTRYSLVAHYDSSSPNRLVLISLKGKPELLIKRCQRIVTENDPRQLFDRKLKDKVLETVALLSSKNERVLGFAQAQVKFDVPFYNGDTMVYQNFDRIFDNEMIEFVFVGLISLQNPIRLTVPEAIFKCNQAGIRIIMITGDHPSTAYSLAKIAGIIRFDRESYNIEDKPVRRKLIKNKTKTNDEIDAMTDEQLESHLRSPKSSLNGLVFARVMPSNKVRIVECLHRMKFTTAVTGFQTSDTAVWNVADVRISSKNGCYLIQNSSDLILLNDDFTAIVDGIEGGRVLFENVKKSLIYTLSSKPIELVPYLLCIGLRMPHMSSYVTILMIDLFTDNLPPISLAYEETEPFIMESAPRQTRNEKLINAKSIIISIFFFGTLQLLSGLLSYLVVFHENGFHWTRLIGISHQWYSKAINDLEDNYGQEWTFIARHRMEMCSQRTFFITLVITRISVLICCRKRLNSSFKNFFQNSMANFSIFFLLFSAFLLIYYPVFESSIRDFPLKLHWWLLSMPFFVLILVLNELRKFIIKNYPHSNISAIISY